MGRYFLTDTSPYRVSDALNPYTGAGLHGQGYHNDQRIITGLKPAKASSGVVAQDAITISQNSATRGDELFVSGKHDKYLQHRGSLHGIRID